MKQCHHCTSEFIPKHEKRGHEQLYCSIKCRTEAYKKRIIEKMQSNGVNVEEQNNGSHSLRGQDHRINHIGGTMHNVNLEILEGKYQAKTEALEFKLRFEQTQKELEDAKQKILELQATLDDYESDEEPQQNGYLGYITDMVKNSPELGNAIGKLMQNDRFQNFLISIIPDKETN